MSNSFSYWNGQPVNAPVYPQMGDLMQQSAGGAASAAAALAGSGSGAAGSGPGGLAGWPGQGSGAAQMPVQSHNPFAAGGAGMSGVGGAVQRGMAMPSAPQMGMGDYGNVSSPLTCNLPTNFFGQGSGQFEPCIDNGEAFCAYNGMDMSMNYGGGSASKGGFW
nr:spidroin-1 [Drosophila suzukii]